jgi:hypothetical protein
MGVGGGAWGATDDSRLSGAGRKESSRVRFFGVLTWSSKRWYRSLPEAPTLSP